MGGGGGEGGGREGGCRKLAYKRVTIVMFGNFDGAMGEVGNEC